MPAPLPLLLSWGISSVTPVSFSGIEWPEKPFCDYMSDVPKVLSALQTSTVTLNQISLKAHTSTLSSESSFLWELQFSHPDKENLRENVQASHACTESVAVLAGLIDGYARSPSKSLKASIGSNALPRALDLKTGIEVSLNGILGDPWLKERIFGFETALQFYSHHWAAGVVVDGFFPQHYDTQNGNVDVLEFRSAGKILWKASSLISAGLLFGAQFQQVQASWNNTSYSRFNPWFSAVTEFRPWLSNEALGPLQGLAPMFSARVSTFLRTQEFVANDTVLFSAPIVRVEILFGLFFDFSSIKN